MNSGQDGRRCRRGEITSSCARTRGSCVYPLKIACHRATWGLTCTFAEVGVIRWRKQFNLFRHRLPHCPATREATPLFKVTDVPGVAGRYKTSSACRLVEVELGRHDRGGYPIRILINETSHGIDRLSHGWGNGRRPRSRP
jgi:hypothetical protein